MEERYFNSSKNSNVEIINIHAFRRWKVSRIGAILSSLNDYKSERSNC